MNQPPGSNGLQFRMEDSELNSMRQSFINNLKITLGSKFDAMFQEFTDAPTLEDKMKVAAKFKSTSDIELRYKEVEARVNFKCSKESEKYLKQGYLENSHGDNFKAIIQLYSKCIAYTPLDSEQLALAYALRSEALYSEGKCRECLADIERVSSHIFPLEISFKLLFRQMMCHRDLGNAMKAMISCMKADKLLKSEAAVLTPEEHHCRHLQLQIEMKVIPGKAVCPEEVIFPTEVPELSYGPNPEFVGASSAVRIEYNEQQGRHLVATRDINIGDVLLTTENLVVTLMDEHRYDHCTHCHKPCCNLFPCPNCVWMMFCSPKCQSEAEEKYHNAECVAYSRFRYLIDDVDNIVIKDVFCRIIRMFATIGIENLQPYFKHARTNLSVINAEKRTKGFDLNGVLDPSYFDAIFSLCSGNSFGNQTDLLMSSSIALQIPQCFGLSMEHPDFFAIAGLYAYLEQIALSNCPNKSYVNFTDPPLKSTHPTLSFNPLRSLINHSCVIGNVASIHYDNKEVIIAKWPIKKGSVLTEPYIPIVYQWPKEQRQKFLKDHCGFECKCIICEENWDFKDKMKCISDPADQELASELINYNENIIIDIHRSYLRKSVISELEKFVKDRSDLLTKLWNKGEFPDLSCFEMQKQLAVYRLLQGNCITNKIDYSPDVVQNPNSVNGLMESIKMNNPPKNIKSEVD